MQTLSETLRTAIQAGNPQRCLFVFTDDEGNETEEFSNEEIVVDEGLRLDNPFNGETELTMGLCPSAQISFTLLNDRRQLVDFEFGTFAAYLGARIDSGTPAQDAVTRTYTEGGVTRLYEFSPLGVFTVERPDVVTTDVISVSATDRMSLLDKEIPEEERSALAVETTLFGLTQILCQLVDVPLATTQADMLNGDLTVKLTANILLDRTYRDVLRWIAEAAGSIAIFNREGALEIRWFNVPTEVRTDKDFDEHDYNAFGYSWYETEAIDGLKIRNTGNTSETPVYPGGVEAPMNNPYVISGNPFL